MALELTVLGSSAMYPTTERAASGYLVRWDETNLWVDAGSGTWRNLLGQIEFRDIHGVVLTHRHPDHVTDIFQAFHARAYGATEPLPPIPLWAPDEAIERITGFSRELPNSFDIRAVESGDRVEFRDAQLSLVGMAHPVETVGVRIDHGGASIAYSADTGPDGDFAALADGAHLFICEATFQDRDGDWEGHMKASQAGEASARVGARRLLLTHLPPGRDHATSLREARARSEGVEVKLARDGARFEVDG